MIQVLDCTLKVREFEFQWRYYIPFRTNTFGERHESFDLSIYELNSSNAVLL